MEDPNRSFDSLITTMTQPTLHQLRSTLDSGALGAEMHAFLRELYPICRSITGEGFRDTQARIGARLPGLVVRGIPSGTRVFDWTVPPEWNITDAYVRGPDGTKVIDFQRSNLHVVSYSVPVRARMSLAELRPHLHTLPEHPHWIPYRTSYYHRDWGFCLAHADYLRLADGEYEVVIDSTLTDDGRLNWGELVLPGSSEREVLISTHACHPSLCNDNLSGVVVATCLAQLLTRVARHYTYRFLFIPGGIGSVVWLSKNQDKLSHIAHGLVLNCLGDPGGFTYKRSRRGNAVVDRAAQNVLRASGTPHKIIDFSPYGYDERNYCSAKFDLPVGSLTRSTHSQFPGYHSSGDDTDLVRPQALAESLLMYVALLDLLERDATFVNLIPEVEPQLGRRGLYGSKGGLQRRDSLEVAMLWVMNQSDGSKSLLDISDRSGIEFGIIADAAHLLRQHGLLAEG